MRFAALCLLVSAAVVAQQSPAPRFDVASVKLVTTPDTYNSGITTAHGRLDASNVTLKRCIIGAWGISPNQVIGGPDWMDTDRFDISAKADQPTEDESVFDQMLRDLLSDRFRLVLHSETRPLQVYLLEVAKGGPSAAGLRKTTVPDSAGSSTNTSGTNTRTSIAARKASMDHLTKVLARELRQPVIDRTGLAGNFDFTLSWTPDRVRANAPADTDLPSIFTAIQDQLGLRLRAEKVPTEVLVIDRAEKPSLN